MTGRRKNDTMKEYLDRRNNMQVWEECGSGIGSNIQPCGCPAPYNPGGLGCVLNQPLMMVIPPEGVHLNCPAHSGGHHIYGRVWS